MNKQQLANKIGASANKMRSKIDANEYKDYILGFIFYKFLSDNEVNYLRHIGWTDNDLKTLVAKPENQEAQACIASYFRSLDTQISLESQRLEKLKQIKSACLDKMFV